MNDQDADQAFAADRAQVKNAKPLLIASLTRGRRRSTASHP